MIEIQKNAVETETLVEKVEIEIPAIPVSEKKADASFYSLAETDYLSELAQLISVCPSGDVKDGLVSIRLYSLTIGKVVLAITIGEVPDSFVTLLPYSMSPEEDGGISIKRLAPSPMCRIFKSTIAASSIPPAEMILPYLRVVKENINDVPGFFNEMRVSQIDSLLIQLSQSGRESSDESEEGPDISEPEFFSLNAAMLRGGFTPPEFFSKKRKH